MYAGELTLRLSSSWMYIAYISLWFDLFSPLFWWIDKKGEKFFESLYMHVYFSLFMQNGEEEFSEFIYACLIFGIYAYMFVFALCISLNIYLFIIMHELRGSFYEAYL